MSKKDESGPAFPGGSVCNQTYDLESDGMTLRDWFASQAINGMIANGQGFNSPWMDHPPSAAEWAYRVADAMIAERAK